MKLQEIFDQLSAGEFSQLSIGGGDAGVIDEGNYARVLSHINLALTTLFTRFNLKEQRLLVPLNVNVDTYALDTDDLLKINKVVTDDDVELVLNQECDPYSCFTPSLNILRVPQIILTQGADLPEDLLTENLTVVYRANHPVLTVELDLFSPKTQVVELPRSHLLPLLYFVASRVHNPIGMSNEFHAGNNYWAKYEAASQALEAKGMQVDLGAQNTRISRGGWV